jgi:hypothetical protein
MQFLTKEKSWVIPAENLKFYSCFGEYSSAEECESRKLEVSSKQGLEKKLNLSGKDCFRRF